MSAEEDERRELERLTRDLAAIDARWNSFGYQQRTSTHVLDGEIEARRELQLKIMKLESALKSSSATPALGTGSVRANVGAWEPLALFEIPERAEQDNELPLPSLEVAPRGPQLDLKLLEAELFVLFSRNWGSETWYSVHAELTKLRKLWVDVPGAKHSSASRSIR